MSIKDLIYLFDLDDWDKQEIPLINQIIKLSNERPRRIVVIKTNSPITERIMRYLAMTAWLGTEIFVVDGSFESLMDHPFTRVKPNGRALYSALKKEVNAEVFFEKRCDLKHLTASKILEQLPPNKNYLIAVKYEKPTFESYERILMIFKSFISSGHRCGISYENY